MAYPYYSVLMFVGCIMVFFVGMSLNAWHLFLKNFRLCFLGSWRMGIGLGSLDGWNGSHSIHVLPAGYNSVLLCFLKLFIITNALICFETWVVYMSNKFIYVCIRIYTCVKHPCLQSFLHTYMFGCGSCHLWLRMFPNTFVSSNLNLDVNACFFLFSGWRSSVDASFCWNHLWSWANSHVTSGHCWSVIHLTSPFHQSIYFCWSLSTTAGSWSFQENPIRWWDHIWRIVCGEWVNSSNLFCLLSHILICLSCKLSMDEYSLLWVSLPNPNFSNMT